MRLDEGSCNLGRDALRSLGKGSGCVAAPLFGTGNGGAWDVLACFPGMPGR